jgi:Domain of unknown function (DUF1905)
MKYLIKDEKLELKYVPGKGSWTYHLQIPNTKNIKGKWGHMKVSGHIDGYRLESKNLAPVKGEDKLLSINDTIRKAINKAGGDMVTVTLSLLTVKEPLGRKQIVESFKQSDVLVLFKQLSKEGQNEILEDILSQPTEEKQIKQIVQYIDKLTR